MSSAGSHPEPTGAFADGKGGSLTHDGVCPICARIIMPSGMGFVVLRPWFPYVAYVRCVSCFSSQCDRHFVGLVYIIVGKTSVLIYRSSPAVRSLGRSDLVFFYVNPASDFLTFKSGIIRARIVVLSIADGSTRRSTSLLVETESDRPRE